jgi:hypothetical protein
MSKIGLGIKDRASGWAVAPVESLVGTPATTAPDPPLGRAS